MAEPLPWMGKATASTSSTRTGSPKRSRLRRGFGGLHAGEFMNLAALRACGNLGVFFSHFMEKFRKSLATILT
jgi:hypothetical protein